MRGINSAFGGRVEICVEQSWTTICDVYWDNQDASVICRQLGLSPYGKYDFSDVYGLHHNAYVQVQLPHLELTLKECLHLE